MLYMKLKRRSSGVCKGLSELKSDLWLKVLIHRTEWPNRRGEENMVETRSMRAYRVLGEIWNKVESMKDVFAGILSQLSVESLQSCKVVSKYWHESISNKAFTNMHLSRSRETPVYIACPRVGKDLVLYLMKPGEKKTCRHFVTIPGSGNSGSPHMVCSFNGLICCVSDPSEDDEEYPLWRDMEIRIFNPATGDSLPLPPGTPSLYVEPCIGVGYGPDISHYKVFRIYCVGKKEPGEYIRLGVDEQDLDGRAEKYLYEFEMYSSITGSWTRLGQVPRIPMHVCCSVHLSRHVFLGGKIYWLVASRDITVPGSVLCMDMEGNYRFFLLPDYAAINREQEGISANTYLITLEGSLCLVVIHTYQIALWIRNEEDVWDLDYAIGHKFPEDEDLITFVTSCGDKLLFVTEWHWFTYDLGLDKWKKEKPCVGFNFPVAFTYTESLLPCNGGVDLGGR